MPARAYQKGCIQAMMDWLEPSRIAPAFFPLVFFVSVCPCLDRSPNPHVCVADCCCTSTSQTRYLAACLKCSSIVLTSITLVSPSLLSSLFHPSLALSCRIPSRWLGDCCSIACWNSRVKATNTLMYGRELVAVSSQTTC